MVDLTYMQNRRKYNRPQGLLFANDPGTATGGTYVPDGSEFGVISGGIWQSPDFLITTDDNRKDIGMSFERIEQRKRTVNGRTRSIHIADKLKLSVSWDMIPSRAFDLPQTSAYDQGLSDERGTETPITGTPDHWANHNHSWGHANPVRSARYTTDGGAGGGDLLQWYEDHPGNFWVFLAYDKFHRYSGNEDEWENLRKYNERVEMYFSDFSYNVVKRGQHFDFWNVSLSLEEA